MKPLNRRDLAILQDARSLMKARKSKVSSVASSLRTKNGQVFRGVSVETFVGFCAEYGAVAAMVTEGRTDIDTIVAVYETKGRFPVLPPCGRCRQLLVEFGNPWVIVDEKRKFRLKELYPVAYKGGFGY